MKKINPRLNLVAALTALFLVSASQANAASFALVGVGSLVKPTYSPANALISTSSTLGVGFGGLLSYGLGTLSKIQVGALYTKSKYSETIVGVATAYELNALEFPVAYLFDLSILHLGLGVSYDMAMGNITATSAGASSSLTYAERGLKKSGFNGLLIAGITVPIMPTVGILLEGRYKLGLTNRLSGGGSSTMKLSGIQAIAGLSIGMGK